MILLLLGTALAGSYEEGLNLGKRFRDTYGGKANFNSKIKAPAFGEGQFVDLEGNTIEMDAPLCRKSSPENKVEILRVTVNGQSVQIQLSSNGNGIDRSYSFSGRYHCGGAVCSSLNPPSCQEFYVQGGNLYTRYTSDPISCADVSVFPQPPTLIASRVLQSLVDDYGRRGIKVSVVDQSAGDRVAVYYGGRFEDCEGNSDQVDLTKYADSPYSMRDDAARYYSNCDPSDPSCQAVRMAYTPSTNPRRTCTIERRFVSSGDRICTPGQEVYPYGYSETNNICYTGDRWKDYSSSFRLRCSSDGKSYELIGWGYWEGAPCGGGRLYPPSPQIKWKFNPKASFSYTEIGKLSVNRRRGGENVIELDRVTDWERKCVSDNPTPYRVWVRNVPYTGYSYLYVRVDNAPGCNHFTFKIDHKAVEEINDGCADMRKTQGCRLLNEWWVDANGNRKQVVKNGKPIVNYNRCEEEVVDNSTKEYTSSYQTLQSPPQNCAGVSKTCRWINGKQVCRTWWKKVREYECRASSSQYTFDLTKSRQTVETAFVNERTGDWGYLNERKNMWVPDAGECEKICVVRNGDVLETRRCEGNVCPGGGTVEENCRCIRDSTSGMGYAMGVMGIINEAFKNRECVGR